MKDEFIDDLDIDAAPKPITPAPHNPSTKIDDLEQDKADCYWCGRIGNKSEMRQERKYNTTVYICKRC